MTSYSLIYNRKVLKRDTSGPGCGPSHRSRLRLLPSGDGWSVLSGDGQLLFSALGPSARQRCLEFAYADGTLALVS
jgi:hypothetical protein